MNLIAIGLLLIKKIELKWKIKCLAMVSSTASSLLERACPDISGRKGGEAEMEDKMFIKEM